MTDKYTITLGEPLNSSLSPIEPLPPRTSSRREVSRPAPAKPGVCATQVPGVRPTEVPEVYPTQVETAGDTSRASRKSFRFRQNFLGRVTSPNQVSFYRNLIDGVTYLFDSITHTAYPLHPRMAAVVYASGEGPPYPELPANRVSKISAKVAPTLQERRHTTGLNAPPPLQLKAPSRFTLSPGCEETPNPPPTEKNSIAKPPVLKIPASVSMQSSWTPNTKEPERRQFSAQATSPTTSAYIGEEGRPDKPLGNSKLPMLEPAFQSGPQPFPLWSAAPIGNRKHSNAVVVGTETGTTRGSSLGGPQTGFGLLTQPAPKTLRAIASPSHMLPPLGTEASRLQPTRFDQLTPSVSGMPAGFAPSIHPRTPAGGFPLKFNLWDVPNPPGYQSPYSTANPAFSIYNRTFDPNMVYWPLPITPPSWREFSYLATGELEPQFFTVTQIIDFLYLHPLHHNKFGIRDPKNSDLELFIQQVPADTSQRYPLSTSSLCRFDHCPVKGHIIHPGHFRLCFSEKRTTNPRNPFHNAGYVHLSCIENFVNFPELVRDLNVKADTRIFEYEPEPTGGGLPRLDGDIRTVAQGFIEECQIGFPVGYPPQIYEAEGINAGTLAYRLHAAKIEAEFSAHPNHDPNVESECICHNYKHRRLPQPVMSGPRAPREVPLPVRRPMPRPKLQRGIPELGKRERPITIESESPPPRKMQRKS
ncbi:MAG: hypothetical protein M1839_001654 [Geoglossum umbratile]|nr:MAG: hypothetical protein M1839_001654 [Geoglossum umbratile]